MFIAIGLTENGCISPEVLVSSDSLNGVLGYLRKHCELGNEIRSYRGDPSYYLSTFTSCLQKEITRLLGGKKLKFNDYTSSIEQIVKQIEMEGKCKFISNNEELLTIFCNKVTQFFTNLIRKEYGEQSWFEDFEETIEELAEDTEQYDKKAWGCMLDDGLIGDINFKVYKPKGCEKLFYHTPTVATSDIEIYVIEAETFVLSRDILKHVQ